MDGGGAGGFRSAGPLGHGGCDAGAHTGGLAWRLLPAGWRVPYGLSAAPGGRDLLLRQPSLEDRGGPTHASSTRHVLARVPSYAWVHPGAPPYHRRHHAG